MSFLEVNDISKEVGDSVLLNATNFTQKKGERLGIVGETGSGKTTLLKTIAGLLQSTSGEVLFRNEKVAGPEDQLVPGHDKIGYLSQHFELPKFITVEDHIFDSYKISEKDVDQLYATCDIKHLIYKDTQQLSGGERQRVALARILRDQPELLLLDEPFSNLDLNHQRIIKEVLSSLESVYKTTLIVVSHDPHDVLSWADRILVLKSGKIIQEGGPQTLYNSPLNEYVAGLFGEFNLINPKSINSLTDDFYRINGQIFLRPTQIRLSKKGNGLKAKIHDIKFMGSYDKVYLKIADQIVLVFDCSFKWQVDEQVRVILRNDN